MSPSTDDDELIRRVLAAHRDYLAALIRAEEADRVTADVAGRMATGRDLREKHVRLRDLLDELGYVPKGLSKLRDVQSKALKRDS